jgi:hypothetical protein
VLNQLVMEDTALPRCVTCGAELHPERAEKYNYCMAPECQKKNAKGLTMVAIGVNKSAEQYMILDESTREDLASGKYHDQRRGSFGPQAPRSPTPAPPGTQTGRATQTPPAAQARPVQTPRTARAAVPRVRPAPRRPWSRKQEKLALLYNEQGLRPDEIAQKLGVSRYLVTQIILAAKNRGKL